MNIIGWIFLASYLIASLFALMRVIDTILSWLQCTMLYSGDEFLHEAPSRSFYWTISIQNFTFLGTLISFTNWSWWWILVTAVTIPLTVWVLKCFCRTATFRMLTKFNHLRFRGSY